MSLDLVLTGLILAVVMLSLFVLGLTGRKHYLINFLLLALLLGPRIPLGQLTELQRFDLRLDDIIIVIMFLVGATRFAISDDRIKYPPYTYFLFAFLLANLVSSVLGAMTYGSNLTLSLLYWGRDAEFVSLAFILPYLISNDDNLISMYKVFVAGLVLNCLWLLWQIIASAKGPLIEFVSVPSYGYTLVGEAQVMATASIYSFALLFFLSSLFNSGKNIQFAVLAMCSAAGLMATLSRTFIASSAAALLVFIAFLMLTKQMCRLTNVIFLIVMLAIALTVLVPIFHNMQEASIPVHRLEADAVEHSLADVRGLLIWLPLWQSFLSNPFIGYGKGSVRDLIVVFDEAHNYYLRILIEAGIAGMILFLIFIYLVYKTSIDTFNKSGAKKFRLIGLYVILACVLVGVASIGQDTLYSSKVAIPFYFCIGLLNYIYSREMHGKKAGVNACFIFAGKTKSHQPPRLANLNALES